MLSDSDEDKVSIMLCIEYKAMNNSCEFKLEKKNVQHGAPLKVSKLEWQSEFLFQF